MQAEALVAFEKEIADSFNNAKIKAPIHLHGDNEKQLIEESKLNQEDQKEAGHHGVPLNVYKDKYYFGQDDPFENLIKELIDDGVIKDFL